MIQKEFGATVTLTEVLFNSVRGGCAPVESCRLSPKESIDFIIDRTTKRLRNKLTPEQLKKISVKLADAPAKCKPEKEKNSIMGCNGGLDSYTITLDGKLLGCQMLDKFQTNALELGFKEAWTGFPFVVNMPEMNEECGACYCRDDEWYGFGTPWCGTSGESINREVPIKALVLLKQSKNNRLAQLNGVDLLQEILPNVVYAKWDLSAFQLMTELLDRFLKKVPAILLECKPDKEALDLVYNYLEGKK